MSPKPTGLLLHGKEREVIGQVKPILDAMLGAGFFVDERLYRLILEQAGELPTG
jgi:predicted nucleic acid-binding protein